MSDNEDNLSEHIETFDEVGAGASLTRPVRVGELKIGHYVMIENNPCKITKITTSKTGKHGHAKANIEGIDIFTGHKYMTMAPTSHSLEQPIVNQKEWQVIDILDDICDLIDADGNNHNIILPPDEDMKSKIQESFSSGKYDVYVSVISAMNKEMIKAFKTSAE